MLNKLSESIGFSYVMYYSPDGAYGAKNRYTYQWNGMVKELVDRVGVKVTAQLYYY